MKYLKQIAIFCFTASTGILVNPAFSATLKDEVTVYSNIVTAKDLFDDAGRYADEPLFLAPDLGSTGRISARRVATEAHNIGLFDISLDGIEIVIVHRPSQKITSDDIRIELKDKVAKTLDEGRDFEITTTSIPPFIHADPRTADALNIDDFRLLANNTRFQATIKIKTQRGLTSIPVRGVITEITNVAILTRDVARDDILAPGDVTLKRIPKARARPGTLNSLDGLIGKAVTRNLRAASILREQEVITPLLIRANDPVSINYSIPGLILTAQGRALDSGAQDTIISVMNLQSRRVIRGRITQKGEVVVEVRKPRFAISRPTSGQEVQ